MDSERKVLFDCGDGTSLALGGRLMKIKNILITHADRDHINGLPQALNILGKSAPTIIHPPGSGSFSALKNFLDIFDPETCSHANWKSIEPSESVALTGDWLAESIKTQHFLSDKEDRHRSYGYRVSRRVRKLKAELRELDQKELDKIREDQGREAIEDESIEPYYIVSGDTIPMSLEQIGTTPYLAHECTFLDIERGGRMGDHSVLSRLLDTLAHAPLKKLLLYHISQRFDAEAGKEMIEQSCRERKIKFPVAAVFSNEMVDDGFSKTVYQP